MSRFHFHSPFRLEGPNKKNHRKTMGSGASAPSGRVKVSHKSSHIKGRQTSNPKISKTRLVREVSVELRVSELERDWELESYDSWNDTEDEWEGVPPTAQLPPCRWDHDAHLKKLWNFQDELQKDPSKFFEDSG